MKDAATSRTSISSHRPDALVATLAFAGIVVSMMQTLVVPLIPHLPGLLHASAEDAAWAVTATLLAACVATPGFCRVSNLRAGSSW